MLGSVLARMINIGTWEITCAIRNQTGVSCTARQWSQDLLPCLGVLGLYLEVLRVSGSVLRGTINGVGKFDYMHGMYFLLGLESFFALFWFWGHMGYNSWIST